MSHIFVSYSRRNTADVDRLVAALENAGFTVWIDRAGIQAGGQWREQIVTAIEQCDVFVITLSPDSVQSDNVRKELDLAEGAGRPVIPVMLMETDIPAHMRYQLAGVQYVNLHQGFDRGVRDLRRVLGGFGGGFAYNVGEDLVEKLAEFHASGEKIKHVAFGQNGWAILRDVNGWWASGMNQDFMDKMWEFHNAGEEIKEVSFTPSGGWVILRGRNGWWANNVPQSLIDKLHEFHNADEEIKSVSFDPDGGWVVLRDQNGWWGNQIDQGLIDKLHEFNNAGEELKQVAFAPSGGWVVLRDQNGWWGSGVPQEAMDKLRQYNNAKRDIDRIAFAKNGGWVVLRS